MNALSAFVNMEKIDHGYVIQYFHLKGLSPTNMKAELDSTLWGVYSFVYNNKVLGGRV